MHPTNLRTLEDLGTPAFAHGNSVGFPPFDSVPGDFDAGPGELGDGSNLGWASAWIDIGGEG